MQNFYIGEISQKTGLNPKTIRFWEEIGLLPKPKRTKVNHGNGYRLYEEDDIKRLEFLKRARLLEIPIEEMRKLLAVCEVSCCPEVTPTLQKIALQKSEEIEQRIQELRKLQQNLNEVVKNFQKAGKRTETNCIDGECLKKT